MPTSRTDSTIANTAQRQRCLRRRLFLSLAAIAIVLISVIVCRTLYPRADHRHVDNDDKPPQAALKSVVSTPREPIRVFDKLRFEQLDNAQRDGWSSEVVSGQASSQLDQLGNACKRSDLNRRLVENVIADTLAFEPLVPSNSCSDQL